MDYLLKWLAYPLQHLACKTGELFVCRGTKMGMLLQGVAAVGERLRIMLALMEDRQARAAGRLAELKR